jgi:hypothetical protein
MLIFIITESKGDIGVLSWFKALCYQLIMNMHIAYTLCWGLVEHENKVIRDIRTKQYTTEISSQNFKVSYKCESSHLYAPQSGSANMV